jgi:hypothetical protein
MKKRNGLSPVAGRKKEIVSYKRTKQRDRLMKQEENKYILSCNKKKRNWLSPLVGRKERETPVIGRKVRDCFL